MAIVQSNYSVPHTWYRKAMMFHDCNSYITAVESDSDPTNPLVRALLHACRGLLLRLTPPRHIRSHQTGTFLDRVLDLVDTAAKRAATMQRPAFGWIAGLQPPQVAFVYVEDQIQDLTSMIRRKVRAHYYEQFGAEQAQVQRDLEAYETLVMHGMVTWSLHLHTVARRPRLWAPWKGLCTYRSGPQVGTHLRDRCPLRGFYLYYLYIKLALWIPEVIPTWRQTVPTPWGVWFQVVDTVYVLAVDSPQTFPLDHVPLSFGITGDIPPETLKVTKEAGASARQIRQLLASFLQAVHIIHVAKLPLQLPIHQEFRVPEATMCLSSAVLVEPENITLLDWSPVYEDHVLWPHLPLLYIMGLRFQLRVAAPLPGREIHVFAPVASLTCSRLFWYHPQSACPGHWPVEVPNIPDTLVFDWGERLSPRGMFAGHVLWVLEYGFPEHQRYISCLQLDPMVGGYVGALALRTAFQVALNMLNLPCQVVHQHYRVAMLPPSKAKW